MQTIPAKKQNKSTIFPEQTFEEFLSSCKRCQDQEGRDMLRKAFRLASEVHEGKKLYTGEPYIIHPIRVAQITTQTIGLGIRSATAALLHEVISQSDYTEADISRMFDDKVAYIVGALTKIPENNTEGTNLQAENFRKLLISLSDDIRVIFIKLADRLHNLRIIDSFPRWLQKRYAGETLSMYAPLAHRLGLHKVKSELEDTAFRILQPEKYHDIEEKLRLSEKKRKSIINRITITVSNELARRGYSHTTAKRTKSIYSIWNKMQTKGVAFNEIYDLLAMRIVFDVPEGESEDAACWNIMGIITKHYEPKTDRIRDWISKPKDNGYKALHVTVLGPSNQWVEIQIRSKNMDEIAELGYAAHWKYKGLETKSNGLDRWIKRTRAILENPDPSNLNLLDEFKLNVFASEILVFTPKGEIKTLPKKSTVLDFAFAIHSELGLKCIGAQIGKHIVPPGYELQSGDKVKVLTSDKARPHKEWLEFMITPAGRSKLMAFLNRPQEDYIFAGKRLMQEQMQALGIHPTSLLFKNLLTQLQTPDKNALYAKLGKKQVGPEQLKEALKQAAKKKLIKYWHLKSPKAINGSTGEKKGKYLVANCCRPIPGDPVMGFSNPDGQVIVHRSDCSNALTLAAMHANLMVDVAWEKEQILSFLATILIEGVDSQGLIQRITNLISNDLNVNIKSLNFDSNNGVFYGRIDLYVHNVPDLNNLIMYLNQVDGIKTVQRQEKII